MKRTHLSLCLLAFLIVAFIQRPCYGQGLPDTTTLEWRVNLLALPLLNPNVGLRINTGHKWKPDFYLGLQLPMINHVIGVSHDLLANTLMGEMGWGMTAYGGFTRIEGDWGAKGLRMTLQMGARAFRTGEYVHYEAYGTGAKCGHKDVLRATFGPRILLGNLVPIGKRSGLEFMVGAGIRAGINRTKVIKEGTEWEGSCLNNLGFVPDQTLGPPTLSIVPTIHASMSLVLW